MEAIPALVKAALSNVKGAGGPTYHPVGNVGGVDEYI
jgi:hypothetical protein